MTGNKHEKIAQLIRDLFEKEFGRFSVEDFNEVARLLEVKVLKIKPDFDKFYKNFSNNDRELIDLMINF